MRNIGDYEKNYMEHPFERYMEKYRRKIVKRVIENYVQKDSSILEIGCGMKPLFCDYEDQYLFTIVEPAEHCYNNAKKIAKYYHNVVCIQGFFEDIAVQLKANRYDLIICSSLLHEVENPEVLLQAILSLCNKETIVHINVPNALSIHRLLAKEMGIIENVYQLSKTNKNFQQHNVFDKGTLIRLVCGQGYKVVESGTYFIKPFTHQQMQKCMDMKLLNDNILDGLNQLCESYLREYGAEIYLNIKLK